MGYTDVRDAVTTWLRGIRIPGVQQVYRDAPWWMDENAFTWEVSGGAAFGSGLFAHLSTSTEIRVTVPAPNPALGRTITGGFVGNKQTVYTCTVGIIYRYLIPQTYPDRDAPFEDRWVDGLDQTIDLLKQRLRTDPTLGAPDVIFQAAQETVTTDMDMPVKNGGYVNVWASVTFDITEIITA